ncbi:MAG: hypothetical protein OXU75_07220 [Deltaproteobacteria bacterium]|nr:hypothetical protein [Deltaproteobacteria bacterium]
MNGGFNSILNALGDLPGVIFRFVTHVTHEIEAVSPYVLDPAFTQAWCAAIVLIFLIAAVPHSFKTWRLRQRLKRLVKELPRPETHDASEGAQDPDDIQRLRTGFTKGFERYHRMATDTVGLPWQEFEETLIKPRESEVPVIKNPGEVSRYLNDDTIIFPRISTVYQSIPNILTGSGILGTFVGLAFGVHAASTGMAQSGATDLVTSLQGLLGGAALAFATSVVGLFFSLVFLFVERRRVRTLHVALDRWVLELETRLLRVTPEGLLYEAVSQQTATVEELKTFNTELVFSIQQALEERIANRLSPQLERLVEIMEQVREQQATNAGQFLSAAVDKFAAVLSEQTGSQFDNLAATVEQLNRALAASAGTFADDMAQASSTAVSQFSGTLETLNAAAAALDQSTRQSARTLEEMQGYIGEMNRLRNAMGNSHELLERAAAPLTGAAENMRIAGDQASRTLADMQQAANRLTESVKTLDATQTKVQSVWETYERRFVSVDASLEAVFVKLNEGLSNYCDQVKRFANELDKTAAGTVEKLAGAVGELKDFLDDLEEILERLTPRRGASQG